MLRFILGYFILWAFSTCTVNEYYPPQSNYPSSGSNDPIEESDSNSLSSDNNPTGEINNQQPTNNSPYNNNINNNGSKPKPIPLPTNDVNKEKTALLSPFIVHTVNQESINSFANADLYPTPWMGILKSPSTSCKVSKVRNSTIDSKTSIKTTVDDFILSNQFVKVGIGGVPDVMPFKENGAGWIFDVTAGFNAPDILQSWHPTIMLKNKAHRIVYRSVQEHSESGVCQLSFAGHLVDNPIVRVVTNYVLASHERQVRIITNIFPDAFTKASDIKINDEFICPNCQSRISSGKDWLTSTSLDTLANDLVMEKEGLIYLIKSTDKPFKINLTKDGIKTTMDVTIAQTNDTIADHYLTSERQWWVGTSELLPIEVDNQYGQLTGNVKYSNQQPAQQAQIMIIDAGGRWIRTIPVDSQGNFKYILAPNNYSVKVVGDASPLSQTRLQGLETRVQIMANRRTQLDVTIADASVVVTPVPPSPIRPVQTVQQEAVTSLLFWIRQHQGVQSKFIPVLTPVRLVYNPYIGLFSFLNVATDDSNVSAIETATNNRLLKQLLQSIKQTYPDVKIVYHPFLAGQQKLFTNLLNVKEVLELTDAIEIATAQSSSLQIESLLRNWYDMLNQDVRLIPWVGGVYKQSATPEMRNWQLVTEEDSMSVSNLKSSPVASQAKITKYENVMGVFMSKDSVASNGALIDVVVNNRARPGEQTTALDDKLLVDIRVSAEQHMWLDSVELVLNGQVLQSFPVTDNKSLFRFAKTLDVQVLNRGWLHVVVRGRSQNIPSGKTLENADNQQVEDNDSKIVAFTNAIFFEKN